MSPPFKIEVVASLDIYRREHRFWIVVDDRERVPGRINDLIAFIESSLGRNLGVSPNQSLSSRKPPDSAASKESHAPGPQSPE